MFGLLGFEFRLVSFAFCLEFFFRLRGRRFDFRLRRLRGFYLGFVLFELDFVEETLASFLAFFAHLLEVDLVDNFSLDFFRNFSGDFGLDALHVRGIALGRCIGKEGERRDCEDCDEF